MKDYYLILEIPRNASDSLIKSHFRKLAVLYHPDKNKNNSSSSGLLSPSESDYSSSVLLEKFMEINEAYKVLSNPDKRISYDILLKEKEKEGLSEKKFSPYRSRLRDGADINMEISFSSDEINSSNQNIIKKNIMLERFIKCPSCNGTGKEEGTLIVICKRCGGTGTIKNLRTGFLDTCELCDGYGDIILYKCSNCGGNGRIRSSEELTLDFNSSGINIKNGNKVRFASKGDEGAFGGKTGGLIILVNLIEEEKSKNNFTLKSIFNKIKK